jgi:hypothetical protein
MNSDKKEITEVPKEETKTDLPEDRDFPVPKMKVKVVMKELEVLGSRKFSEPPKQEEADSEMLRSKFYFPPH